MKIENFTNGMDRAAIIRFLIVMAAIFPVTIITVIVCAACAGPMKVTTSNKGYQKSTVRVIVLDEKNCLPKNKIDVTAIKKKLAKALDANISDTASDVPQVTLTVLDRDYAPVSKSHLIMTHLTVAMPGRAPSGGPGGEIAYNDQRSSIDDSGKSNLLKDAIDNAISSMHSSFSLTPTDHWLQEPHGPVQEMAKEFEDRVEKEEDQQLPAQNSK